MNHRREDFTMSRATVMRALAVGMALCAAVGCGKKPAESAAAARYLVVFSQCNNAEPYRAAQNALLRKLFAEYPDVNLVITDAQQDNARQISQIETSIRQKPNLLIVAPNERAPLTAEDRQLLEEIRRENAEKSREG